MILSFLCYNLNGQKVIEKYFFNLITKCPQKLHSFNFGTLRGRDSKQSCLHFVGSSVASQVTLENMSQHTLLVDSERSAAVFFS